MTSSELKDERFNVVQFFDDGTHEYVRRAVDAREAVAAMNHYIRSVAASMGMVTQVMITDMLDQTVFHWTAKDSIIFPTRADMESMGEKK